VASAFGHSGVVAVLGELDADVDRGATAGTWAGYRPIHVAIFKGKTECIIELVEAECNLNAVAHSKECRGFTALDIALKMSSIGTPAEYRNKCHVISTFLKDLGATPALSMLPARPRSPKGPAPPPGPAPG